MSKGDILDNVFDASCKLELIKTVIEHLIHSVEDKGEITTPEQAMNFAYQQGAMSDFLHITHDGVFYAIQRLNEAQATDKEPDEEPQSMTAKGYKKEIISMLDDMTDNQILKLIYGFTKSGYKEEQAEKRIADIEQRGECDE